MNDVNISYIYLTIFFGLIVIILCGTLGARDGRIDSMCRMDKQKTDLLNKEGALIKYIYKFNDTEMPVIDYTCKEELK